MKPIFLPIGGAVAGSGLTLLITVMSRSPIILGWEFWLSFFLLAAGAAIAIPDLIRQEKNNARLQKFENLDALKAEHEARDQISEHTKKLSDNRHFLSVAEAYKNTHRVVVLREDIAISERAIERATAMLNILGKE